MRACNLYYIVGSFAIVLCGAASAASGAYTKNIMLTGYWGVSSEMLTPFCTDTELNPEGWIGYNWNNTGYNIYAYFADYSTDSTHGVGDFEVDYLDTHADFWQVVNEIHPVAILNYGLGEGPWELEYNAWNLSNWDTYFGTLEPPDPSPPDSSVPLGYHRYSTLPIQEIADAINEAEIGVDAWIDWDGNAGNFLCGYMFYLDCWYQSLHDDPSDPYQCLAAGFTHVGDLTLEQATAASEIALLANIDYLNTLTAVPEPSTLFLALIGLTGLLAWRKCFRVCRFGYF